MILHLSSPRRLLLPREGVADNRCYTVWELLRLMHQDGWSHIHWEKSKKRPVAYEHGMEMVWYTHGELEQGISQVYLLALMAEHKEHRNSVLHFEPNAYYEAWLDGKEYEPNPKKRRKSEMWEEALSGDFVDFEEESDCCDEEAPKPKRPRTQSLHVERSHSEENDLSEESDCCEEASDNDDKGEDCCEEASDNDPKGEDSSSSSSTSTSSSSTHGEEEVAQDNDEQQKAQDNDEQQKVDQAGDDASGTSSSSSGSSDSSPGLQRTLRRGWRIGPFLITPKGDPAHCFQVKCYVDHHKVPGSKSACNRSISFRAGDDAQADLALRYCKNWCCAAQDQLNRPAHQGLPRLRLPHDETEIAALPTNEQLDQILRHRYGPH